MAETGRRPRPARVRSGHSALRGVVWLLGWLSLAAPAGAEFVIIDDPGNPADPQLSCKAGTGMTEICRSNIGSVGYSYAISEHEVTNAEYVEFLNAVADADPGALFNPSMQNPPEFALLPGELVRTGSSGSYVYSVVPGAELRPVRFINFRLALRYANWLHNGKPTGAQTASTTEDGVYTLVGTLLTEVERNPGATYWLPNEDEWYKAAFYDPTIPDGENPYFDFATGSDVPPSGDPPPGGENSANVCPPDADPFPAACIPEFSNGPGETTDVGSYVFAPSPWGLFDQVGNVWELLEDRVEISTNAQGLIRGGSFARGLADAAAYSRSSAPLSATGNAGVGFRIATVPEPSALALQLSAAASMSWCARQRRASRAGRGRTRPAERVRSGDA